MQAQPTNQPAQTPNLYQLSGKNLNITYSTGGIDGKPHFSYQDLQQTLDFTGDEIRSVELKPARLSALQSE